MHTLMPLMLSPRFKFTQSITVFVLTHHPLSKQQILMITSYQTGKNRSSKFELIHKIKPTILWCTLPLQARGAELLF
jgi:hypothetical protein